MFVLNISAEDENSNLKNAVYSYNKNLNSNPLNIIVVDLKPNGAVLSFASVNKITLQNTSLVLHDADKLQNCTFNYDNSHNFSSEFKLNLIDLSNGQVVCKFIVAIAM